jgi:tRNA pseudouridine32 synthase/23S rRNA pseudouridine746 synthase
MNLPIFFENENLVIVDKPGHLLSVPSRLGKDDPRSVLGLMLQAQLGIQIYPCHRLDECVSGLIIYAKNPKAHQMVSQYFEKSTIQKTYYAWTSIDPSLKDNEPELNQSFRWESQLTKGKRRAFEDLKYGKDCLTFASCIERKQHCLFWALSPQTGRSHQLRFELFQHGFPIWGDVLYGSPYDYQASAKASEIEGEIALRMVRFDFQQCPKAQSLGLPAILETTLPQMPNLPENFDLKSPQTMIPMIPFQKRKGKYK